MKIKCDFLPPLPLMMPFKSEVSTFVGQRLIEILKQYNSYCYYCPKLMPMNRFITFISVQVIYSP